MIQQEIAERLDNEADRLRDKYGFMTAKKLERIARDEYNSFVLKTSSIVLAPSAYRTGGGSVIFYHNSFFRPNRKLTLGHEIGHIVAGHLDSYRPDLRTMEEEADYFSARINHFPSFLLGMFNTIDAFLSFYLLFTDGEQEKKRVRQVLCDTLRLEADVIDNIIEP